jgi:DNA polymerase-3 subunit gamma/tau
MRYLALARKWRPRTFSQLLGQEHINRALVNSLNQKRIHHAYLFTGTRGVGKTSIARIFAKALNCEQGISSEPCLTCDACVAIEQGRFIDLIEIDGASRTRVEDTRDLLDNVHYAPANGRYKIYLIDEVHMLSQHSFNALLKTLEEPPEKVLFILATTDPQKVPVTVLSRCLQFNLRHLPDEVISLHIQHILKDEQLDFEVKATEILAHAARGSMRDALSLLDQAITSCGEKLLEHDVKMILGYTQQDYALQLLHALAEHNPVQIVTLNQAISVEGEHFLYVLDELLNYLHQIAIYQSIGDKNALISPSLEVKKLAQLCSPEDIQLFYQIALKGREELHLAPTLSIGFSMTLLRMLTFRPAPHALSPNRPSEITQTAPAPKIPADTTQDNISQIPEKVTATNIDPGEWTTIIPELKLTGFALTALENTEFVSKEDNTVTLSVAKGHQSLFNPTTLTRIEAVLGQYYQTRIKIILNYKESIDASPAQKKTQSAQLKQEHAEEALLSDPLFQQLKQDFSGDLVKNSIVSLKDGL